MFTRCNSSSCKQSHSCTSVLFFFFKKWHIISDAIVAHDVLMSWQLNCFLHDRTILGLYQVSHHIVLKQESLLLVTSDNAWVFQRFWDDGTILFHFMLKNIGDHFSLSFRCHTVCVMCEICVKYSIGLPSNTVKHLLQL